MLLSPIDMDYGIPSKLLLYFSIDTLTGKKKIQPPEVSKSSDSNEVDSDSPLIRETEGDLTASCEIRTKKQRRKRKVANYFYNI